MPGALEELGFVSIAKASGARAFPPRPCTICICPLCSSSLPPDPLPLPKQQNRVQERVLPAPRDTICTWLVPAVPGSWGEKHLDLLNTFQGAWPGFPARWHQRRAMYRSQPAAVPPSSSPPWKLFIC